MTSNDPNTTAAESAIRQIGTEFRRLRMVRGERIEDIASYLDVKATSLFGIEQGDLSVIPGRREAKFLVRSYANYLGLDGETIIGPMDPIIASLKGDKAPPEPKKSSRFDRTSAIILAASVILGVLVGWSWIGDVNKFDLIAPPVTADGIGAESSDILDGADVEAVPVEVAEEPEDTDPVPDLATEDLSTEAAEAADALLVELKTALDESAETLVGEDAGDTSPAGDPVQVSKEVRPSNVLAALVAERGDGAHIYEADNTDARVIVRALSEVSVQVASHARDYVWTRTMKPREMLLVPNRDDLELWTGDAAGVEILLDGGILPPLGPPSTAVSGLSLAASSLESLSTTEPKSGADPTF